MLMKPWPALALLLLAPAVARAATPDGGAPDAGPPDSEAPADVLPAPPDAGRPIDLSPPPTPVPVESPATMQEVTVVGTRERQTAGSAHIVKEKTLERFEQDNPEAVLKSVPGVYSRGED